MNHSITGPRPARAAAEPSVAARRLWVSAGWTCIAVGTVGIVVPLLPTVDFYAIAAFCFARSSPRCEAWLLNHPRIGPLVRDWRADRSVPLRAKCLATLSMAASCAWAAHVLPVGIAWLPAAACLPVAAYLWSRPTRARAGKAASAQSVAERSAHADLA